MEKGFAPRAEAKKKAQSKNKAQLTTINEIQANLSLPVRLFQEDKNN